MLKNVSNLSLPWFVGGLVLTGLVWSTMIITACQSKSSTIIPVFLQPLHISSHWKHSQGCHRTECLTAVCLDRIGAAATANCREKFGWPHIKAILADFAVLIWNVYGEKIESLKLVELEIDTTDIPCSDVNPSRVTPCLNFKHPISCIHHPSSHLHPVPCHLERDTSQ